MTNPLAGLASLWPTIRTVIADAGHESRRLARQLRRDGWSLQIVKRKQRAFKVAGLTWIVERNFAWLGFNRRMSKDYERFVQTSETLLGIAAIRLMLNRVAPVWTSHTVSQKDEEMALWRDMLKADREWDKEKQPVDHERRPLIPGESRTIDRIRIRACVRCNLPPSRPIPWHGFGDNRLPPRRSLGKSALPRIETKVQSASTCL